MNQIIQSLNDRKSVRDYLQREIEPEKKEAIIQAALQAPTAGNMTLYTIIDVTDQAIKDQLSVTCDHQLFISKAPMVLVFCADYHRWYEIFCKYEKEVRLPALGDLMLACDDALIAAQNAVVAAQSFGIGSCYIGDIMEHYEIHKELFHLPKYVIPAAMLVFGYPTAQQEKRTKPKRVEKEAVVYENSYCTAATEVYENALKESQSNYQDFGAWLQAFCKRKWNSDFSREMSRSVQLMMESWIE